MNFPELLIPFAFPAMLLTSLLAYALYRRYAFRWTREPFHGEAVVTKKEYVRERRTGAMVHTTHAAEYLVYYRASHFEWYLDSKTLFNKLKVGDRLRIEGVLTYRSPKKKPEKKILDSVDLHSVREQYRGR